MKTSVKKDVSREFNNDPRVHMDAVFPNDAFTRRNKQSLYR